ncbi:MAG: FtsX-like permease family protein [Gemmataceae bacterium]|nr:FtsX-like permease family protein [Gemmataceae bacterium]
MRPWLAIARSGLTAVALYRLRSTATVGCVVAVLLPLVAGLGLSQGLHDQGELAVGSGPDLYVTARQFGRTVPIPLSVADVIREVPGVVEVTPRIVGPLVLGAESENAVLVGLPVERFPASVRCVAGALPREGRVNELVVGTDLARRLRLKVGAVFPPFYRSTEGERLSRVVGLFTSDAGLWQSRVMLTTLKTAGHIFNQQGSATDFLVTCRPGYAEQVTTALLSGPLAEEVPTRPWRLAVISRTEAAGLLRAGVRQREGIFALHWLLVIIAGIMGMLVTSGVGLRERRREIGILKATGWQTSEVLWRCAVENLLLATAGAALSILLAYAWLRWLNGFWLASVVLPGVDVVPSFPVPFRLAPVPSMLAVLLGLVVVLSGSLASTWRAAVAAPATAMR